MKITPFTFEPLIDDEVPASNDAVTAAQSLSEIEEVEPEIAPPTFSEEELEEAKKIAHDNGFMAGKKEGVREAEMKSQQFQDEMGAILRSVETSLQTLQTQYAQALQERQPEIGKLVYSCAQKIAGSALEKNPIDDISTMIEECMAGLFDAPKMEAVVHPDIADTLRKTLPSDIDISTDESLSISDCKLQWQHGFAMRDTADLWAEIEHILERHFSSNHAIAPASTTEEKDTPQTPTPAAEEIAVAAQAEILEDVTQATAEVQTSPDADETVSELSIQGEENHE